MWAALRRQKSKASNRTRISTRLMEEVKTNSTNENPDLRESPWRQPLFESVDQFMISDSD
jgi:hypothetical protein